MLRKRARSRSWLAEHWPADLTAGGTAATPRDATTEATIFLAVLMLAPFLSVRTAKLLPVPGSGSGPVLTPLLRCDCFDGAQFCTSSTGFTGLTRSAFPAALVVADRFHVVRLALHQLMRTCLAAFLCAF